MKKLLQTIGNWLAHLFGGLLPKTKNALRIAISITEAIKNFDLKHGNLVDIATQIIPSDIDNKVKDKIRSILPELLLQLQLVDATLGLKKEDEILAAALKTIQSLDKNFSNAFLHSIAVLIAQVAADGKLDFSDAVFLVEFIYNRKKN